MRFDVAAAGGTFLVGDHWEFAARTADASVEELVEEPPRGVLHHHMKLGIVTFPGTVTDCRPTGPDGGGACDCGCDLCVTPESHASGTLTIQAAVNKLRAKGGKICLQVGVYRLEAPVIVDRATSLQIEGKGWKTIVLAGPQGPAFVVERSIGVIIDMLTVITGAVSRRGQVGSGTAIALSNTIGTIIERCVLLQLAMLEPPQQPPGDDPGDPQPPVDPCPPEILKRFVGREVLLVDLRTPFGAKGFGGPVIALQGLVLETLIQENVIVGTTGIGSLGADLGTSILAEPGALGAATHVTPWPAADDARSEQVSYLLTFDLAIEDNLLLCWLTGVSLEGFAAHEGDVRITGNSALACLRAGFATTGVVGDGGRVDIARNTVRGLGVGIAFAGDDTRVADNDVRLLTGAASTSKDGSLVALGTAMARSSGLLSESLERVAAYLALFGGAGIVAVPGLRPSGIDRAQIRGNRVTGIVGDGIALQTRIVSAQIDGNVVQQVGGDGITMSEKASAEELAIEDNQLIAIGRLRRGERAVLGAVVLRNVVDAVVLGNQIRLVGAEAPQALGRFGVLALGAVNLRVGSNSILDVGAAEFAGVGVGVLAGGVLQRVDVHDNTIRRSTRPVASEGQNSFWAAIGIVQAGAAALSGRLELDAIDRVDEQASTLGAFLDQVSGTVLVHDVAEHSYAIQADIGRIVELASFDPGSVGVHDNVADSTGRGGAILVAAGVCVVGGNRATFLSRAGAAAVLLTAGQVIANANQVEVLRQQPAIKIQAGPCTVLGNVTTGPIVLNGAMLGPPWDSLNA